MFVFPNICLPKAHKPFIVRCYGGKMIEVCLAFKVP